MERKTMLAIATSAMLLTGACTQNGDELARAANGGQPEMIEQPDVKDLPVAPESSRVDLTMPSFSNPTEITNPLFPISEADQVIMLGTVDGLPFRSEVTRLPDPRIIEWNGRRIETVVSQYAAYLDGRIHEVALDHYAQADDGSVWYFGEDVFNYENGVIADTEGTWFAGRDGPAAMIMPANPSVGDTYRPENIPNVVFEEVTVRSTGKTMPGPSGSIDGSIVVRELHMDGKYERKTFAPGYGEFFTGGGCDVEAVAVAVPTDALAGPTPAALEALATGAVKIFEAVGSDRYATASSKSDAMTAAWKSFRSTGPPRRLAAEMTGSLKDLDAAIDARRPGAAQGAAIDVARAALDLQLRHRPQAEIDLGRLELWARQLLIDLRADDAGAISGDLANFEWVRDRVQHTLASPEVSRIDLLLGDLRLAAIGGKSAAAADAVAELHDLLVSLNPK